MKDWQRDQIDLEYLSDSGLLFKINQTVAHLFGIGIGIQQNSAGEKCLSFIDRRDAPEELIFPEAVFELGEQKYQRFREEFGGRQIIRRQEQLGSACQNYPWVRKQ